VPSLQMNICITPGIKNKKTNLDRSHALKQWFNAVSLETKVFQLLGPTPLPLEDPTFVKFMQDVLRQAVETLETTTSPQSGQMTTASGRSIGPAALDSLHDQDSDDEELRAKEDSDDAELSGEDSEDMD
jgi:hypothetical protein